MEATVITLRYVPRNVPVLPSSDKSMAMTSRRGINIWSPIE